ncbi:MAG TPA: hypothetical protein VN711_04445 [Candidatus Saccharimonadales bacterium]|nr:hypothetical protein [Candidatus Saccharimonadales bacterium]
MTIADAVGEALGTVANQAGATMSEAAQTVTAPVVETASEVLGAAPLANLQGMAPGTFVPNFPEIVRKGDPHKAMEKLAGLPDAAMKASGPEGGMDTPAGLPDAAPLPGQVEPLGPDDNPDLDQTPGETPGAPTQEASPTVTSQNVTDSEPVNEENGNEDVTDAITGVLQDVPEDRKAQAKDLLGQIDNLDPATLDRVDPAVFAEMIKNHPDDLAISPFTLQTFLDAHYDTDAQMMRDNAKAMGMDANGQRVDETELRQIQIQAQMEAWRQRITSNPNMPEDEKKIAIEKVNTLETKLILKEQMSTLVKKMALKLLGVGQIIASSEDSSFDASNTTPPSTANQA